MNNKSKMLTLTLLLHIKICSISIAKEIMELCEILLL